MPIDPAQLERHLKDYAEVTGKLTRRFVCPITLRECSQDELVEGHILNRKLRSASRKTIIQYARVDHFFGSRVEPGVVQFFSELSNEDGTPLKHERPFEIVFDDGTKARAFADSSVHKAEGARDFTTIEVHTGDGPLTVSVEVSPDDPRLSGKVELVFRSKFLHFQWVAAMLKVGFLTWFDMRFSSKLVVEV